MSNESLFQRLRLEAGQIAGYDEPAIRDLLREAHHADLTPSQIEVLKSDLAERLKMGPKPFEAVHNDVRSMTEDGVILRTTEDVADHVIDLLRAASDTVEPVFAEGLLYSYHSTDDPDAGARAGVFENTSALVRDWLSGHARMPVLNTARKRDAAYARVCERLHVPEFFEDTEAAIVMRNGVLRYDPAGQDVQFGPHGPEYRARSRIEADYDPEADAPVFAGFLQRLFPDCAISRTAFLRMTACSLFAAMPPCDNARTTLVLVGPRASGKSTAAAAVKTLHDPDTVTSVDPQRWSDEKYLAMLINSRLNVVTELNQGRPLQGDVLKKVASWEPVTARRLFKDPVSFVPRAINLWCCNQLPRIAEQNDSIERRFCVLETGASIDPAEMRPDIVGDIKGELPGVVNLLARAFVAAQREGAIAVPDSSRLHVVRMQYGDDPAQIVGRHWLVADAAARTTSKDLQAALRHVCDELALPTDADLINGHMRRLSGLIATVHGGSRVKDRGWPVYKGVRLRPELATLITEDSPPETTALRRFNNLANRARVA